MDNLQVRALAALDRYQAARCAIRDERFIQQEPVAFKVYRRAELGSAYCELIGLICQGAAQPELARLNEGE